MCSRGDIGDHSNGYMSQVAGNLVTVFYLSIGSTCGKLYVQSEFLVGLVKFELGLEQFAVQ